ncbi:MAG TPA: methionyl-tRNA formyltransferase [Anaerolineae bacterium]|nr:methionyl-tRNA formyltransferase [Anaerolineae bacterium]
MRIFFMGTPQLAVPTLKSIIESKHQVILVVTQPDKPVGRQRKIGAPPVKLLALAEGIPIAQPLTLKDESFKVQMEELQPDIGVVFAYGKIIPQWLLSLPRHGIVNVHASLLPRWRGAAPIQRAIMAGDPVTGITIMQMVMELDAGDTYLQQEIEIKPDDTAETVGLKMSDVASDILIRVLDGIEAGTIFPKKQDESKVTYANKITDEDVEIDWAKPAESIFNQVRALNPKPGAHTHVDDMLLKVWWAAPAPGVERGKPGTVVHIDKNKGIYVATSTEPLLLTEVQPANRKRISGAEFVRGYRLKVGDVLGHRVHD